MVARGGQWQPHLVRGPDSERVSVVDGCRGRRLRVAMGSHLKVLVTAGAMPADALSQGALADGVRAAGAATRRGCQ